LRPIVLRGLAKVVIADVWRGLRDFDDDICGRQAVERQYFLGPAFVRPFHEGGWLDVEEELAGRSG
jgi:hypothetical protein